MSRLGRFREGYQQLRESIEAGTELPFRVQVNDDNRSSYVTFKSLTVKFAALLGGRCRVSGMAGACSHTRELASVGFAAHVTDEAGSPGPQHRCKPVPDTELVVDAAEVVVHRTG